MLKAHPVAQRLMELVQTGTVPAAHVSSYWEEMGQRIVVEVRADGNWVLQDVGIGHSATMHPVERLLHVIERLSYLPVSSRLRSYPAIWRLAKQLARETACGLTFDVWKYAMVLATIVDHCQQQELSPKTFALIGDGNGFFGALLRRYHRQCTIYSIDLPKSLVFQVRMHVAADATVPLALLPDGLPRVHERAQVVLVAPQHLDQIPDTIDFAVSVASMQEMTAFSIASYFTFLRRRSQPHSRFYCISRLCKELPGGEVCRFEDYPWALDDEVFLNGVCPFYTHSFSLHTSRQGPRVLGWRIPCVNYFDGVHVHRLVHLTPEQP